MGLFFNVFFTVSVLSFVSLAYTEDHGAVDHHAKHKENAHQESMHEEHAHKKSEHKSHTILDHNVEKIVEKSAEDKQSAVESLSPELREVLSKEMLALQEGMKSIIPAYISGNWPEVSSTALQMKNSYIMKQKLSNQQIHEIHSKLPPLFIELDQEFHYLAGMLAHAAEMKKPELIGFYYSKLGESCVACHTKFATHKFPAFIKDKASEVHQH